MKMNIEYGRQTLKQSV